MKAFIMKNLLKHVAVLSITTPLSVQAFDFGTAVRSYSITNNAMADSKSKNERLVEQLARKIDNGDEIFLTDGTRKDRFVGRFEQALAESGITPSRKQQTTNAVRVELSGVVAYELWLVAQFAGRDGVDRVVAERYFFFCDKGIIGTPGSAYYKMEGETKMVKDAVYLLPMASSATENRVRGKKEYEAVCGHVKSDE